MSRLLRDEDLAPCRECSHARWNCQCPVEMEDSQQRRAVRCPDTPRFPGDLVGCGSTNVERNSLEGGYECLDCGLWFTPDAAAVQAGAK